MHQRTYETRLPEESGRDALLDGYAELYGRAQRTLFARLCAGEPLAALKRVFLVRFGLTARQFNALAADVAGTIAGIKTVRLTSVGMSQMSAELGTVPRHQKARAPSDPDGGASAPRPFDTPSRYSPPRVLTWPWRADAATEAKHSRLTKDSPPP